jgi:hypothetical protein
MRVLSKWTLPMLAWDEQAPIFGIVALVAFIAQPAIPSLLIPCFVGSKLR